MENTEELLKTINNLFLCRSIELTHISNEVNMRESFKFEKVHLKSSTLWLMSSEDRYLTLDSSSIESWYLYGPDSLVFILASGSTITLRQNK